MARWHDEQARRAERVPTREGGEGEGRKQKVQVKVVGVPD